MSIETPLELKVRIDFQDYWRATHSYMLGVVKFRIFMATAILFVAVFVYSSISAPHAPPAYPLLIPPAGLIFLYGMLYLNTKYLFAGKKFLQHEVRYVFTSEGVNAIAEGSPGETSWSAIPKAFELKDDFLIFYTAERMYTIPKRCFAGAEDLTLFRNLLASHLGNKAKLQI